MKILGFVKKNIKKLKLSNTFVFKSLFSKKKLHKNQKKYKIMSYRCKYFKDTSNYLM